MFSRDLIDRQKSNIANLVTIIIFVVISINVYKNQTGNIASMNEQKEVESKKNKALENISQLEKKIDNLTRSVNSKDISNAISDLNNMAREFSIKITSIRPLGTQDSSLYVQYPFELTVEANNYHQIGKFISKVESNPNVYTVQSITMHPSKDTQGGPAESVVATIKISTVLFKTK